MRNIILAIFILIGVINITAQTEISESEYLQLLD